ncbi:hypothetical protein ACI2IX_18080 [Leifsonia aquatica]|uniref:hypothetical protein n=1 Tax=Leifsonia aquatica TaxID=144185 RepID=UPI00384A54CB
MESPDPTKTVIVLVAALVSLSSGTCGILFQARLATFFTRDILDKFPNAGKPVAQSVSPTSVALVGLAFIAIGIADLIQFIGLIT